MCIAIECSYKLDQNMNLNFCVNYAHFRKSGHIYTKFPKEFNKTYRYCVIHTEKEIDMMK